MAGKKGKKGFGGCLLRLGKAVLALALLAAILIGSNKLGEQWRRWRFAGQGMPIRAVYQYDYPEAVCAIAGESKSVATSGCGAVCMSMVIDYLVGDWGHTPQTLFEEAWSNGDYTGNGLSQEALSRLGKAHGVGGVWIGPDAKRIRQALELGYPVIAHMGPGTFTREGHYILLRGLSDDGRVLLNDPNSENRTGKAWDLEQILREGKGTNPFMVCRRE